MLEELLSVCGLEDLREAALGDPPLARDALERILAARNPLAAAALADLRRRQVSGDRVTLPCTLRVRWPGIAFGVEPAIHVSYPLEEIDGIDATEIQMVVDLPDDLGIQQAAELIAPVHEMRPDLGIRAFTTDAVLGAAGRGGRTLDDAIATLAQAGLTTLDWAPASDSAPGTLDVHRAAHAAGLRTSVALPYSRATLDVSLLDRIEAITHDNAGLSLTPETNQRESYTHRPDYGECVEAVL